MIEIINTPKVSSSYPKSDAKKPITSQERLGQVFTPDDIADIMVRNLITGRDSVKLSLLDPCSGPGTFLSAIKRNDLFRSLERIQLVEIDESFRAVNQKVIQGLKVKTDIKYQDYLTTVLDNKFDLLIMNPPYIRQEWLTNKKYIIDSFKKTYGLDVPGTSNLYSYFVIKGIFDLKVGGSFSVIIYDSWEKTKYGKWLKRFLKANTIELEVTQFTSQPFQGRLIDATVITGIKKSFNMLEVEDDQEDEISLFQETEGFSTIENLFYSNRGLRLKQADFFLGNSNDIKKGATPFLKKISKIKGYNVDENHDESAFLLSKGSAFKNKIGSELTSRLKQAQLNPEANKSILTWYHEKREEWYTHKKPEYSPILFNYYLRNRPFHIYSKNIAHSDNFYGLKPKADGLEMAYLAVLNSTAVCAEILAHSRNQGSELAKIQLFEFRKVRVPDLSLLSKNEIKALSRLGMKMLKLKVRSITITNEIDQQLFTIFGKKELDPRVVNELYDKVNSAIKKRS